MSKPPQLNDTKDPEGHRKKLEQTISPKLKELLNGGLFPNNRSTPSAEVAKVIAEHEQQRGKQPRQQAKQANPKTKIRYIREKLWNDNAHHFFDSENVRKVLNKTWYNRVSHPENRGGKHMKIDALSRRIPLSADEIQVAVDTFNNIPIEKNGQFT